MPIAHINNGESGLSARTKLNLAIDGVNSPIITASQINAALGLTASQLVATDGSSNLRSLAVATYPSLTELSYVKGASSAIQTQFSGKQPSAANLTSVAGLTYAATSFVKMTGAGTFGLDTNTYITSLAGAWLLNGNTNGAKKTLGSIDNFDIGFLTNNAERMTILANGNVGIGTASPGFPLDIASIGGPQIQLFGGSGVGAVQLSNVNGDLTIANLASTAKFRLLAYLTEIYFDL